MDEYIGRKALLTYLQKCKGTPPEVCYTVPLYVVKMLPVADAVEVVRCKDCAMYEENKEAHTTLCRRELSYLYATPNGGCTYGKRKDGPK